MGRWMGGACEGEGLRAGLAYGLREGLGVPLNEREQGIKNLTSTEQTHTQHKGEATDINCTVIVGRYFCATSVVQ